MAHRRNGTGDAMVEGGRWQNCARRTSSHSQFSNTTLQIKDTQKDEKKPGRQYNPEALPPPFA